VLFEIYCCQAGLASFAALMEIIVHRPGKQETCSQGENSGTPTARKSESTAEQGLLRKLLQPNPTPMLADVLRILRSRDVHSLLRSKVVSGNSRTWQIVLLRGLRSATPNIESHDVTILRERRHVHTASEPASTADRRQPQTFRFDAGLAGHTKQSNDKSVKRIDKRRT